MRFLVLALVACSTLSGTTSDAQAQHADRGDSIQVIPQAARTVNPGAAANFTGQAQVEQLFGSHGGSRITGGIVTFQPGARSAWHTHPLGQILIVTAGTGLVQQWSSPARTMRTGDVVWIPAGIKHWHGASPSSSVTHIAIQEVVDAHNVEWLETVSDEQYSSAARAGSLAPVSLAAPTTSHPTLSFPTISGAPMPTKTIVQSVSPALEAYTESKLIGEVWKRPDLSPRDRSIITVAALISRNQTIEMPYHFGLALDNGVKPAELSEIIFHLAFYCGWPNAMAAVMIAHEVFAERGIRVDQLPAVSPPLSAIEPVAEERRATRVAQDVGPVSQGLVEYTGALLFHDLWLRPGLAPRDRSLVTVSALVAAGQSAQITFHLNKAMDNGLTRAQASEVLTHLAFYAGWPNAMSAVPVVKAVFDSRPPPPHAACCRFHS
jgi:4-carboxymuconolactone decarboxylase